MKTSHQWVLVAAAAVAAVGAGCSKKVAVAPPAPPAPVATPAAPAPQRTAVTPRTPARTVARATPPAVAPRTPPPATRARIDELLARIEDAYFDYDKHNLRPDAIKALQDDSAELRNILKDYPSYKLTIEGHCDERGSEQYNMALGDERARAAKDYLVQVGIPADQFVVLSYGKEKPVCEEHDEACWQKNRRVHIVAMADAGKK